jgi:hypothetical protein
VGDVRVSAVGDFAPAVFVAALTDFGPNRSRYWGNSSAKHFAVHEQGDTWAEVTEGGSGAWQRIRYDWATPNVVRLDVMESNAFGRGSYWQYRLTPNAQQTRIDLEVHRVPTTRKGKVLDLALRPFGALYFGRDLRRSVRRIEKARR